MTGPSTLERWAGRLGLVLLAVALLSGQADPDAWWHLRVGAWTLAHGGPPTSDVVSWWSGGSPWISPSWLNELLLVAGDRAGGMTGQSLAYLPVLLAIVWLFDRCLRWIEPGLRAFQRLLVSTIAFLACAPVLVPRAADFDLLFLLVAVLGWLEWRAGGRLRWLAAMPVGAVLWANLHGGGISAYAAAALAFGVGTWLDRGRHPGLRWRPFLASVALSLLAFGVTPYGPALYAYPWTTLFSPVQTTTIAEWLAPDFATLGLLGLRLVIAIGLVVGLARSPQRDAAGALLGGGLLFLALGGTRHLLITIPLLALWYLTPAARGLFTYVASIRRRGSDGAGGDGEASRSTLDARGAAILTVGVAIVLVPLAIAGAYRAGPVGQANLLRGYPVAAAEALAPCPGRIWTDYAWGGWVSWRLDRPVGPYGAADALGDERLATAAGVERLTTDPAPVFDDLHVDAVVTAKGGPLGVWLGDDARWRVLAVDGPAVTAVRAGSACDAAVGAG